MEPIGPNRTGSGLCVSVLVDDSNAATVYFEQYNWKYMTKTYNHCFMAFY